jgi:hypothetical protein
MDELEAAIPPEGPHPTQEAHVLGLTKIRGVRKDCEFYSFQYRFRQIPPVVRFSEEYCQATPSNRPLDGPFDVYPIIVPGILTHGSAVPEIHATAGPLFIVQEATTDRIRLNSQELRRSSLANSNLHH